MLYGTVIQYFPAKRYGFIRPDDGPDVFFHATALGDDGPVGEIKIGQPVKYELLSRRELRARDARLPEKSSKPARADRREAKVVELIDRIPGAVLTESPEKKPAPRHPRARSKKPTWRR